MGGIVVNRNKFARVVLYQKLVFYRIFGISSLWYSIELGEADSTAPEPIASSSAEPDFRIQQNISAREAMSKVFPSYMTGVGVKCKLLRTCMNRHGRLNSKAFAYCNEGVALRFDWTARSSTLVGCSLVRIRWTWVMLRSSKGDE